MLIPNFQAQEFIAMFIDMGDGQGVREVVDETPDTFEEAVMLALVIASFYAHPHVHYWSNGVAQLINTTNEESNWDLAEESNNVTQWMNHAAVFASWFFYGNTASDMANILQHNLSQGLPLHFRGTHMKKAAENSKAHQIQKVCRSKIKQLHPDWPQNVITSVVSATVLHSSDHYYIDKYLSFSSQSKYLKMDLSFHRASVIGPNKYYSRSLKCCERLDDQICEIIYNAALMFDPEFAHEVNFACGN